MSDPGQSTGEVRLAPESIEALADRLAEVLGASGSGLQEERKGQTKISAAEVSKRWAVSRRWVYNHAEALGARRLGSGPRPRLRFDSVEVEERLGAPPHPAAAGDGRRLTASARFRHSDSLCARRRAMVDDKLDR